MHTRAQSRSCDNYLGIKVRHAASRPTVFNQNVMSPEYNESCCLGIDLCGCVWVCMYIWQKMEKVPLKSHIALYVIMEGL